MTRRWSTRQIPSALVERYERDGWWSTDTLGAKVAEWLADSPDATVHIHSRTNGWHGTYADIDDEARRLIALLVDHGIEPGAVVAFQLPNWREAIVSFAALAMGGYVLVPIVHIYGRREVSFILDECGAEAYISPSAYGHVDYDAILDDGTLADLRLHIVVGGAAHDRTTSPGIDRISWTEVANHEPAGIVVGVDPRDVVVLAYTSGTTSDPKGVIHDHRTLLSELRHMAVWIDPDLTNLMGSPVTHATGMLGAVLGPLRCGGAIHVIDRWDPEHALAVMAEYGIGGGTGASVFLASLLDHPDFTAEHAAKMTRVGLGGAPVPVALGRRAEALGIRIIRAYGSTEHPSTTGSQFDDDAARRHTTDGPPMPAVELRLVDVDGVDVAAGRPGEILSRGPELCLGYTDPVLNVAFDDDGWYHTGDIGIVDPAGCLTITDRLKDVIIRGGENLSAAEIEQAMMGVTSIAEVAVVAAPDARLGEHACAIVRLQPGASELTMADLATHLDAAGIARQKWPEELRIVADFPRTPSGKIRKVDLRANLRSEAESSEAAPRTMDNLHVGDYLHITVTPLTGAIGAEISGVDLAHDLANPAVVAEIHAAWLDHLVVVFRGQGHLDNDGFLDFARTIGTPIEYPFVRGFDGYPEIIAVTKRPHETVNFGGIWHSDTTYLAEPPMATMLIAREIPPAGGDTLFANQYLAFEALSPTLQELLTPLRGVSSSALADVSKTREDRIRDAGDTTTPRTYEAVHPVVRTHPVTGRKALYVNIAHTARFDGMSEQESRPMLAYLFEHQVKAEFTCRLRWEIGSVTLWDNRCAMHNPVNDYHGHQRVMHRITLAGDTPV